MSETADFVAAAELVRSAEAILFITGAGISADSGLPTYRGIGGLYEGRDTAEGIPIEVALSGDMLRTRPEITWRHLWDIVGAIRGARPNSGHEIIARWTREKPRSWVLTQNVDGLHREVSDHHLIEVHGRAELLFCMDCGHAEQGEEFLFASGRCRAPSIPRCEACHGVLRPDVVLFDEFLSEETLANLVGLKGAGIDLVFSIGTSSLFPYIIGPVEWASRSGVPCIEINPKETAVSPLCPYRFRTGCTRALREIDSILSR